MHEAVGEVRLGRVPDAVSGGYTCVAERGTLDAGTVGDPEKCWRLLKWTDGAGRRGWFCWHFHRCNSCGMRIGTDTGNFETADSVVNTPEQLLFTYRSLLSTVVNGHDVHARLRWHIRLHVPSLVPRHVPLQVSTLLRTAA